MCSLDRQSTHHTPNEEIDVRSGDRVSRSRIRPYFSIGADVIFKELRNAQSKDELFRKSIIYTDGLDEDENGYDPGEGGQLLMGNYDEKSSAAVFQQAVAQWRQGETKKVAKKQNRVTHETGVDTVHDADGRLNQVSMPAIKFRPSKLTYGEKLLLKKYRRATRNNEQFFQQPSPRAKAPAEILILNGAHVEIEVSRTVED